MVHQRMSHLRRRAVCEIQRHERVEAAAAGDCGGDADPVVQCLRHGGPRSSASCNMCHHHGQLVRVSCYVAWQLMACSAAIPVHYISRTVTCATVVTGGCRFGMMMARPKAAALWGTTEPRAPLSRTCRCQSSGRVMVRLSGAEPLAAATARHTKWRAASRCALCRRAAHVAGRSICGCNSAAGMPCIATEQVKSWLYHHLLVAGAAPHSATINSDQHFEALTKLGTVGMCCWVSDVEQGLQVVCMQQSLQTCDLLPLCTTAARSKRPTEPYPRSPERRDDSFAQTHVSLKTQHSCSLLLVCTGLVSHLCRSAGDQRPCCCSILPACTWTSMSVLSRCDRGCSAQIGSPILSPACQRQCSTVNQPLSELGMEAAGW
jgi:hypothetical protein